MDTKQLMSIYKLKNITRYNNRNHIKNESVAEHSFYVALISLLLCDEFKLSDKIKLKVLEKALLHDMPEIEINDITHDAKQKLKLTDYLIDYEMEYYKENFPQYVNLMKINSDIIQSIVDLADAYSVEQFITNEIVLGNLDNGITEIYDEIKLRTGKLKKDIKDKLDD